jgi:predicted DNA repair protein MutK
MPLAGLLALLDDVTAILDDVATMTKVASQKTSAIVGDDLALNANQLTGISANRELPVLFQVAKGSLVNKVILIPAAIAISALAPSLVVPLLMIGGAFLCYEGAEKVLHKLFHNSAVAPGDSTDKAHEPKTASSENDRIKGAVLTDFILSAEIIIIALGATTGATLTVQALTLTLIGLGMTVIVYGFVALIIKADDVGLHLLQTPLESRSARWKHRIGSSILVCAPVVMRALSVLGTAAMFLVGGEILSHGIHFIDSVIQGVKAALEPHSPLFAFIAGTTLSVTFGFFAGIAIIGTKKAVLSLRRANESA